MALMSFVMLFRLSLNPLSQFVEEYQYVSLRFAFFYPFSFCIHFSHPLHNERCHVIQFSNLGTLEAHGFARNRFWKVDTNPSLAPTSSNAYVDLLLTPSEEDIKLWSYRYIFPSVQSD